ncbi:hypothetical protein H0X90_26660 [Burkholderia sp. 9775_39]|uniref:hypothetical protein n=1 Tax=unclassified Burkholderia TaxID=2613784 RepID=UPI0018C434BD|nr:MULTISPECIES: hypothetical protein [unclassified Burkholderia]MBG0880384.1 hypothetical protein [Burkholderia sp. 9775_39]MBG0886209.1 hypothetical protein [Burkholderia sp. 9773_38]
MSAVDRKHPVDAPTDLNAAERLRQQPPPNGPVPAMEIFVVHASTMYEGSDPVRAFATRESAEAFAQMCRDHEEARPLPPGIDAPEHEWDRWTELDRTWEQTHPAAPLFRRESYDVLTLPFDPS